MEVSVADLTLSKNGIPVLKIPRLSFPSGSTTAVFGPNGSGKTTLLRVIAGLEQPATGSVRLDTLWVQQDPAARKLVGLAFQNAVFVRGSVGHNLELALQLREVPKSQRRSRIEEAAAECGVAHLLDRPARRLSSGEAQRVNLARTLALRAPVTLLDEPLSGVDRIARTQLLADLPKLLAKFTATTILVTHDREEAFRLADRLVVLIAGQVKVAGTKARVYAHPPDRETAELLGYTVLTTPGGRLAIPPGGLQVGDGTPGFTVAVEQVIDMGNHLHVVGMIGNERVDIRLPSGVKPPAPGSEMKVHPRHSPLPVAAGAGDRP
jgi:ABC-type sugar transport system ATPase subunit